MVKWIREWFTLSVLVLLSFCLVILFWATWPLLSSRLLALPGLVLNQEAITAIAMLFFIVIGYIKLLCGKN
ncbi:MAG: hypothetical protein JXA33_08225 [Anaerolineae bacterium]|nr:hypothetical protein [Anaerolineae bacterium]